MLGREIEGRGQRLGQVGEFPHADREAPLVGPPSALLVPPAAGPAMAVLLRRRRCNRVTRPWRETGVSLRGGRAAPLAARDGLPFWEGADGKGRRRWPVTAVA
jgi:hypothetical protein